MNDVIIPLLYYHSYGKLMQLSIDVNIFLKNIYKYVKETALHFKTNPPKSELLTKNDAYKKLF
jgi:hypothetical protein